MNIPTKIGLAGRSGSGKDLIADFIGDRYQYHKIAIADGIREECTDFLQNALETFAPIPNEFNVVINAFTNAVWDKPTSPEMRVLMQWWGTEYRCAQDSEYWTKLLAKRLDNNDKIVVSDVRTPKEVDVIRRAGGQVWFVERHGVDSIGIAGHFTEVALDGFEFDWSVLNDGTKYNLFNSIIARFSQ